MNIFLGAICPRKKRQSFLSQTHLKLRNMSKAEERALEKYPVLKTVLGDTNYLPRIGFIEGYHQAEKDLELGWEDMRELYIIFAEVDTEIELCKTDIKSETFGYYQEVLKRFRERKEKCR